MLLQFLLCASVAVFGAESPKSRTWDRYDCPHFFMFYYANLDRKTRQDVEKAVDKIHKGTIYTCTWENTLVVRNGDSTHFTSRGCVITDGIESEKFPQEDLVKNLQEKLKNPPVPGKPLNALGCGRIEIKDKPITYKCCLC